MRIGAAAHLSGLSAKTIRYYEDIGLVAPPDRTATGYRDYDERQVRLLMFVHRARDLGFTVEDCRSLLALYTDRQRASSDVKKVAEERVAEIDNKIAQLKGMRAELKGYITKCHGDDRPDCPILDELARPVA